ncbi:MAG: hypothetical protein KBT19_08380 [Lachnospiraceae bacterium]|nr:hypothetical protein [Candidatus Colinaster equi]
MKNKAIVCILINLIIVISLLAIVAYNVIYVDPYMHYHYPHTDKYFYTLTNERSMNDGIMRHFDYDTVVTGTSMTENFKTSEVDEIFGGKSVKVPFSGGTYKEIDSILRTGYKSGKEIRTVIRCLDYNRLVDDKDAMRYDLGRYPAYLYNNTIIDDEEYLFNRELLFGTVHSMKSSHSQSKFQPGITSFDKYANWMKGQKFGRDAVYENEEIAQNVNVRQSSNTADELEKVSANVEQNVVELAKEHPETTFYLFFSPYSIAYWQDSLGKGVFNKHIEAEKCAIEQMLECENIYLFSFDTNLELTANLDNYKDSRHYGEWVNTWMLEEMKNERYRLTKENYLTYLKDKEEKYVQYDYTSMN